MSLVRGLAHGFTSAINPDQDGTAYLNQGPAATGYGGSREPVYLAVPERKFQVQAAGYGALRRAEALNIQGVKRQVYFNGYLAGVERLAGRGGDILGFLGSYWLVVDVLEEWDADGWVKVMVTQQVTPPANVVSADLRVTAQSAAVAILVAS